MQRAGQIGEAVQTFERGLALALRLPLHEGLRQQLRDQLAAAKRLQLVQDLHRLADEVRVLYATEIPTGRARSLAERCDAFWQRRGSIVDILAPSGDPGIADDLKDIAIFAAGLQDNGAALRILDEAAEMFGPSAVIEHERRTRRATPPLSAATPEPRTTWEHYALGRALLGSGDLARAGEYLAAARRLEPAGRWENFYFGLCAYRSGQHQDAVTAFSVCIGTAPDVAGYFYHRALAHAALGNSQLAREDHDHALRLDPALPR
jgi:tetratricopeptide (TPR) repeat protein